jgi:bifunctional NMN adenylyltransferase/nudix hydrolase
MTNDDSIADAAVYIGRFQPFHAGHAALLKLALATAPLCVVVLGSSYQARTPKNPFTWQERAHMIRLALAPADRERVVFVPVRDYYDEQRWTAAVREGVAAVLAQRVDAASIALVGHFKDATSEYLRSFAGWRLVDAERCAPVDATAVRDAFFGSAGSDTAAALATLVDRLPQSTLEFLGSWSATPTFDALAEEWRGLRTYREAWACAPYPPVFVTVDAIVRCAQHVLLVRRGRPPGKGLYAAPGGFIEQRETAYQSAVRELREETSLDLPEVVLRQSLRTVRVFDHPDRSQRGRTITHAHFFDLGDIELPAVSASDDAESAAWLPIDKLTALEDQFHDDHFHMLDHFLGLGAPASPATN